MVFTIITNRKLKIMTRLITIEKEGSRKVEGSVHLTRRYKVEFGSTMQAIVCKVEMKFVINRNLDSSSPSIMMWQMEFSKTFINDFISKFKLSSSML